MNNLLHELCLLTPELIILATALLVLVLDLVGAKLSRTVTLGVMYLGLVLALVGSALSIGHPSQVVLHGLLVSDDVTHLLNAFIILVVLLCYLYSADYLRAHQMPQTEYYVLGLLSTVGMMTLVSSHHLLALYLGLELLSLPLYAMTALSRAPGQAPEAAMKYFVMGAVASAMLLYGMSLLYGATGLLDFSGIAAIVQMHMGDEHKLLAFALVFIAVGLGFKLAVVPFHMWAPDVYEGAPTVVTLFIAAAPKIAALGMTIRILTDALPALAHEWQQVLLIMALLSTALGNGLAIIQNNIKRLFAYSTVSHMGYALFGVLAATTTGYAAAMYYVIVYALMSAGALGLVVLLSRQGVEINSVNDLRGLNRQNPWLACLMMIILFSMAGIPPTVGFFSKLFVLKALIDVHYIWVAVFGLLFAVVGAFYSLRLIKIMYFDAPVQTTPIRLPHVATWALSLNSLALLYLGIFPSALVTLVF
jgi:NADH-quinone oxidoreductase subunit N